MHVDFEDTLIRLASRLEALSGELAAACDREAEARADYEESFHVAVVSSGEKSATAREQEARAATVKLRRAALMAEARSKALRAEQAAISDSLSAYQTLARGVYRQGG